MEIGAWLTSNNFTQLDLETDILTNFAYLFYDNVRKNETDLAHFYAPEMLLQAWMVLKMLDWKVMSTKQCILGILQTAEV